MPHLQFLVRDEFFVLFSFNSQTLFIRYIKLRLLVWPLYIARIIVGLSRGSIFTLWVALELNLILFLGLCWISSMVADIRMVKYFLVQALSSVLFVWGMVARLGRGFNLWRKRLILMGLLIKLGLPPFHL